MKSTYINYLRLINNKLIREGVRLPIKISDNMSLSEIEEVKTILEGYCYFNDVLSKCDSAYAMQIVNGCGSKLYTDIIKDDVFKKYKEKFDNALSLLCQDEPSPLEGTATVASLANYVSKNGRTMTVDEFAVEVDGIREDISQSFQYSDIFAIKQTRELMYTEDGDADEDFDYSEDEESEGIDVSDAENQVDTDLDEDDDVFYDFSDDSEDEEFDYSEEEDSVDDEEFDYSDEEESQDAEDFYDYEEEEGIVEELPLDDTDDSVFFSFGNEPDADLSNTYVDGSENYEDDAFSYEDEEISYEEEEISYEEEDSYEDEFDYSEDVSDNTYEDDEFSYEEDEFSYEDEEISYEEDDSYEDDSIDSDDDDSSYEDDVIDSDDEEFSYDDSDSSLDDEDDFSYEDESYDESSFDNDDMPVFNVGDSVQATPVQRKKEDYEVSAETIQGIVEGGTKILKRVGGKVKDSLFSKKD